MDILKILSRSTKQPNKASSKQNATSTRFPSAGTSANPQLYHDSIPEARGTKRKRGAEKIEVQSDEYEEEELDFFAPKAAVYKTKKSASTNDVTKPTNEPTRAAAKLLDEAECRQIMKSHRVKTTLLPSSAVKEKKAKKSSKKAKVVKKRDESKPLYPQPLVTFEDLRTTYGISGRLGDNLIQQAYKLPTEVQMGSLPLLLQPKTALSTSGEELDLEEGQGVDLLAVAPTGSGKTLAFLIPALNGIIQRRRTSSDRGSHVLEAIIVAPTKELASQIVNEAKKLSIGTGVKIVGMRKGMKVVRREDMTQEDENSSDDDDDDEENVDSRPKPNQPPVKADILVTTPLMLLHALSTKNLPSVLTLILDEADVLLDPLFREQTLGIWNSCTNFSLRVTLWSATMGSNIETLALSTIHARHTKLGINSPLTIIRLIVGLKDSAIPNITHKLIYTATEPGKLLALRQLLHPTSSSSDSSPLRPPFLVFTQTIPRAIALHSELLYDIPTSAGGSTRLAVLHSSLTDSARSSIMSRFRAGEIWVLITTDILSRGVDFKGVNGVVNYDVPGSAAVYVHRVGRTGRAGRDGGVAVTFYTKEDVPSVRGIANVISVSEKQGGKAEGGIQDWLLDVLPKVGKEEKRRLKMFGVEARRGGLGAQEGDGGDGGKAKGKSKGRGKKTMLISTKSGYERKLKNNRWGAIEGSRRRKEVEAAEAEKGDAGEDSEWGGIDD